MQTYEHIAMSFGAGVQSTAMLLLLIKEPDKARNIFGQSPDAIYFSDPGAEGEETYRHLAAMKELLANRVPFYHLKDKNIMDVADLNLRGYAKGLSTLPLFTKGKDGKKGMLMRKCTDMYKVRPLRTAIRNVCQFAPRSRHPHAVGIWLGISTDEATRMKTSNVKWADNLYPLIELGWSRKDCYEYCVSHSVYPSKSRCYFCPFTSDWDVVKAQNPAEFAKAVAFDESIRHALNVEAETYLHRSCLPLEQAVMLKPDFDYDGFDSECSGHCGI